MGDTVRGGRCACVAPVSLRFGPALVSRRFGPVVVVVILGLRIATTGTTVTTATTATTASAAIPAPTSTSASTMLLPFRAILPFLAVPSAQVKLPPWRAAHADHLFGLARCHGGNYKVGRVGTSS